MNWDAIGAIGEVLGGVLVLASLVFLAVQVRQANRIAQGAAEREFINQWNDGVKAWGANQEIAGVMRRCFSDFESATPEEQGVFHVHMIPLLNHAFIAREQSNKGLLPVAIADKAEELLSQMMITPGGKELWEYVRPTYITADRLDAKMQDPDLVPFSVEAPWWSDGEAG